MILSNRMSKAAALLLMFCLAACGETSQAPKESTPAIREIEKSATEAKLRADKTVGDIFNFHRVKKRELYRSGQIQKEEFQLLKDFGVKTIISFNNYEVAGFSAKDEARWAKEQGITFIHEEMHPWNKPSLRHLLRVVELMKNSEKPVLIHCQGGSDRTGMAVAAYKMIYENWSYDAVFNEMLYYGFNRVEYGWQDVLKRIP